MPQLQTKEETDMKSKISKQAHDSYYSKEKLRVVIITLLVAASLIAAAKLLFAFKEMLFG